MRHAVKSLLIAMSFFVFGYAATAFAAEPFGTWQRPSTGSQLQFYDCGGKLCAKVTAVKDEARKKEIGTVIIHGMVKSGENKWEGDLLNLDDGKTYSGVVTLESASALNLKGCVMGILCKGETWRKVK